MHIAILDLASLRTLEGLLGAVSYRYANLLSISGRSSKEGNRLERHLADLERLLLCGNWVIEWRDPAQNCITILAHQTDLEHKGDS